MVFDSFFNTIFSPLINFNILFAVIFISFLISLIMTLAYKWMTDQHLMKSLKEDMKSHQSEIKKHKDNPQKMLELQKLAMDKNMKYMMHSMKPTLVTFIPIIIIFGWLSSSLAYVPLYPTMEFSVTLDFLPAATGHVEVIAPKEITILEEQTDAKYLKTIQNNQATFKLKGTTPGEYILDFKHEEKTYSKDILISTTQQYKPILKAINDDAIKSIKINHQELKIINLFGWKLGWLGTYILTSIIFSMGLRKLLKLH
ncbi:DUF106 domain-containing protein [Candidatus Woesearchaeota archaeon]|nr:DUF106 domain-containing protein [Candidatus Woesearchaeota archaeon]